MAMNEPFDWRRSDRRLYAAVAVLFPLTILIGFGPSYYFKGFFNSPALPNVIVHVHGVLMSVWVVLFGTQVYLISSKRIKLHQRLGIFGCVLAPLIVVAGTMTGIAGAARGATVPGISPLSFLIVPVGDVFVFAILFAGAIYYRKNARNHKRLMLLTVLNFLPPALGRFPTAMAGVPPFFWGVPDLIAVACLVNDTWRNRKLNIVFLAGVLLMITSHVVRLAMADSPQWLRIAEWLTGTTAG